ncbi:hypothetical protein [Streptomyces sp. NPDC005438]|uniref:hypothetical protein n=1 Tax=Streptomyces sp. NPDC005438 TaxID=3156880 RepID=UPI0033B27E3C
MSERADPEEAPDTEGATRPEAEPEPESATGATAPPRAGLVFDDPLSQQASDDQDFGWGERPTHDSAADLARFLHDRPPHHL